MKRNPTMGLAALSLAALACTCGGLLGGPRNLLPGEVQEGLEEIEAVATEFDVEGFEEGVEDLEQLEESFGLGAEFPSEFPLPEGMAIETAFELDGSITAVVSYSGAFEDAVAGFETALSEGGYSIDSKEEIMTPVGGTVILEFSGPDYSGNVTIAGSDEAMGIQVSLTPSS